MIVIKTPIDFIKRMDSVELHIYLSEQLCVIAIVDSDINKLVEVSYYFYTNLSEISVALAKLLTVNFKQVKICYQTDKFLFLPIETTNAKYIFTDFGFKITDEESILSNTINEQFVYFIIPNNIIAFFENRFKTINWLYGQTGLINLNYTSYTKNTVYIYIEQSILSISVKENNNLLFFNTYKIKEKEDALYFIQLIFKQLELDNDTQTAYLYGFIEEQSPIYTLLYNYFRELSIDRAINKRTNLLVAEQEKNLHYFINVLTI